MGYDRLSPWTDIVGDRSRLTLKAIPALSVQP